MFNYLNLALTFCLCFTVCGCGYRRELYTISNVCQKVKADNYHWHFERRFQIILSKDLVGQNYENQIRYINNLIQSSDYSFSLEALHPNLQKIFLLPESIKNKYLLKFKTSTYCFKCEDMEELYQALIQAEHINDVRWSYYTGPRLMVISNKPKECL